jgi:hypothetical protein
MTVEKYRTVAEIVDLFYVGAVESAFPFNEGADPAAAPVHGTGPGNVKETEMRLFSCLIASLGVVFIFVMFPRTAEAEVVLTPRGCQSYASWSGNLVWARDLGADKEKARDELVGLDKKEPSSIYALMLRNLDSLWTTNANWEAVTILTLQDCLTRRGRYGSPT